MTPDENDNGFAYGDIHEVTGWASYEPAYWISVSGRPYHGPGRR